MLRWTGKISWHIETWWYIHVRMEIIGFGGGVTKSISSVLLFFHIPKQTSAIEYHVYIWHVSPQLSCSGTCQICVWFKESDRYFCKIKNFAYGEINERTFSNPTPGNRLLPPKHQSITSVKTKWLSIGASVTSTNEIWIKIQTFLFIKYTLRFCLQNVTHFVRVFVYQIQLSNLDGRSPVGHSGTSEGVNLTAGIGAVQCCVNKTCLLKNCNINVSILCLIRCRTIRQNAWKHNSAPCC